LATPAPLWFNAPWWRIFPFSPAGATLQAPVQPVPAPGKASRSTAMTGDMVVALAGATVDGQTVFGHNSNRPARGPQPLVRQPGRAFAAGETVRTQTLEVPQARQTFTVLGSQPDGCWGYDHGVNEHQVAVGCVGLAAADPGAAAG